MQQTNKRLWRLAHQTRSRRTRRHTASLRALRSPTDCIASHLHCAREQCIESDGRSEGEGSLEAIRGGQRQCTAAAAQVVGERHDVGEKSQRPVVTRREPCDRKVKRRLQTNKETDPKPPHATSRGIGRRPAAHALLRSRRALATVWIAPTSGGFVRLLCLGSLRHARCKWPSAVLVGSPIDRWAMLLAVRPQRTILRARCSYGAPQSSSRHASSYI